MKRILSSLIIVLVLFIGICFNINVKAATGDVYNIVTCPSEDMSTGIQINFQSPTTKTNLKVEYTEATDTGYSKSKVIDGTYRSFSRADGDPKGAQYTGFKTPRHIWNVAITGLTPSTKYIYRILDGSAVLTENYAFETASATEDEFSFLFLTDPQYYNEVGANKFNVLAESHIANDDIKFTLISGDISDKGGNSSYWDMFYTKSSLRKIPYITTVGNHEYYDNSTTTTDNVIYNQYFFNPQNGPENVKGSTYYFVYNGALFIMLDSEERGNEAQQMEWFKNVCNTVSCSYIIVGCHRSAYAGGPYVSDGKNFIAKWGPIFDACQVDLVLSGHDHVFARTKSIYANEVTTEKYKGTTYILGGSAGTKYYSQTDNTNKEKWACSFDNTTCGTVITLGKESLKTKTYTIGSTDGKNYKPGTIKDEATIDRKRFGEIDESFTKEEFEKSFSVKQDYSDLSSGAVTWSEKGYGYVQSITCTNLNSNFNLGTIAFINNLTTKLTVTDGFWIGEVNKIKVDILYKDGTKSTVEFEFDNTIDWGEIKGAKAIDITTTTFSVLLELSLKPGVEFIERIRVVEDGKIRKNFFLKEEHLSMEQIVIEMNKTLMEPNTTHTYQIQAMNVNGTITWEQELVVTSLRELTEDEIYQNEMANLAFKAMIDNLLAALGQ